MTDHEAKYNELFAALVLMRDSQIKSERYRCSVDRAAYLRHQRTVDNMIKKEFKERQSLQQPIFKP